MKARSVSGDGETARDALEALAFIVRDEEVDETGTLTIKLSRATVRQLGSDATYEGFCAEVIR